MTPQAPLPLVMLIFLLLLALSFLALSVWSGRWFAHFEMPERRPVCMATEGSASGFCEDFVCESWVGDNGKKCRLKPKEERSTYVPPESDVL